LTKVNAMGGIPIQSGGTFFHALPPHASAHSHLTRQTEE
jgi:hypothetical protein